MVYVFAVIVDDMEPYYGLSSGAAGELFVPWLRAFLLGRARGEFQGGVSPFGRREGSQPCAVCIEGPQCKSEAKKRHRRLLGGSNRKKGTDPTRPRGHAEHGRLRPELRAGDLVRQDGRGQVHGNRHLRGFLGEMAVGQNQCYHLGVGAPPILVYFSSDWDLQLGYGTFTHLICHEPTLRHSPLRGAAVPEPNLRVRAYAARSGKGGSRCLWALRARQSSGPIFTKRGVLRASHTKSPHFAHCLRSCLRRPKHLISRHPPKHQADSCADEKQTTWTAKPDV